MSSAWITVCDPEHPRWQFFAQHARIKVDKTAALVNANFRLLRVPLIWLPYATAPAGEKVRQSGFLLPVIGNSSSKGFVFGDAFYWAPNPWMDTTVGAELLSRRGSAERGHFRAKPWENTSINYTYFGVIDRGVPTVINPGLPDQTTQLVSQGGHEQRLEVISNLKNNWRFVTDWNELSSLTFRLAFADNFGDAINSEVRSSIFLTHNFDGYSFDVAALNDNSFLTVNPVQTSVSLRNAPEARFSSVDRAPFGKRSRVLQFRRVCRRLASQRRRHRHARRRAAPRIRAAHDRTFPFRPVARHHRDRRISYLLLRRFARARLGPDDSGPQPVFDHAQRRRVWPRFSFAGHSALFPKARLNEKIQTHDRAVL